MLSHRKGVDCKGYRIPFKYIDPYPAKRIEEKAEVVLSSENLIKNYALNKFRLQTTSKDGTEQRPMSSVMCTWLIHKFSLCRPNRLPDSISGDRGQLSSAAAILKFDRLHCENVTVLQCQSLVSIQFLHGVLLNSTLLNDDISGCPHGAIRFCPTNLLKNLIPGITILVYDVRSSVSVACSVEGRVLSRTAAAFKLLETNIPGIANRLAKYASKILKLTRVDFRCTAVALDLNSILYLHHPMAARDMDIRLRQRQRRILFNSKSRKKVTHFQLPVLDNADVVLASQTGGRSISLSIKDYKLPSIDAASQSSELSVSRKSGKSRKERVVESLLARSPSAKSFRRAFDPFRVMHRTPSSVLEETTGEADDASVEFDAAEASAAVDRVPEFEAIEQPVLLETYTPQLVVNTKFRLSRRNDIRDSRCSRVGAAMDLWAELEVEEGLRESY
jgi:hypothetical protein